MRNAWNTVLKATEKQTKAIKRERRDLVCGIVDTDTPRMIAQALVTDFVTVFYRCHSDVQLYRPTSVVEIAAVTVDMTRTKHSSTENFKMLPHLENFTEHVTYQRKLII